MAADEFVNNFQLRLKRMQFGGKKQLAFLEDLYVLVSDGIPPNRALEMLSQVSDGINKDVAASIAQKISEGQALAEGMSDWFSTNVTEIIRVGEEGGALAQTMKSAINSLGQKSGALGGFISALVYPLVVIIMACAIILYLDSGVFVQFKAIKPIEEWPDAGRQLLFVAGLIRNYWWVIIVVVVASIFIFRRVMDNYTGELRVLLDKIPPFSIYRQFTSARFLETLGLLVANGVVFRNALKVMQYQANPYLNSHLMKMEQLLSTGKGNVADVLSTGLVEEKDILRLRVMAEVKGFEQGLVRMGQSGAEASTKTVKFIGKAFGLALLMVGGGLIIVIIRGIFLTGMTMGQ